MEKLELCKTWLKEAKNIVFFGGAGVSTESGIPDFRSPEGLYENKFPYPPEIILSRSFFYANPELFYEFYKSKMIVLKAQPNIAHKTLTTWEKEKKLSACITQNIDGLHQKSGANQVIELHGSIYRNYCMDCGLFYDLNDILKSVGVPRCTECNGIIKPDVVLYEESLDETVMNLAVEHIKKAELLLVAGTSLSVYPAAHLLHHYKKNRMIMINYEKTTFDERANISIHRPLGEVMKYLM